MLVLLFSGWMQCRLATDPDPFDETRGVTGYTFALPGEPDLDRIIRFQPDGAIQRRFSPQVGVLVHAVRDGGRIAPRHPLNGAVVDLLDQPVYEGRNGLAGVERDEAITPLHIRVSGSDITLRHGHTDGAGTPLPLRCTGVRVGPAPLGIEAGLPPTRVLLAERKMNLVSALAQSRDPITSAALQRRLDAVIGHIAAPQMAEQLQVMVMTHAGTLEGDTWECHDPKGLLPMAPQRDGWEVEIQAGAYDPDTLCAWISGRLAIPVG